MSIGLVSIILVGTTWPFTQTTQQGSSTVGSKFLMFIRDDCLRITKLFKISITFLAQECKTV